MGPRRWRIAYRYFSCASSSSSARNLEHQPLSFPLDHISNERERQFEIDIRRANGLEVKRMLEDGNCLFRVVADQVYGDYEAYDFIRQMCIDCMTNVDKDQVKDAIKSQQDQQINNTLLAEGRLYSDLDLTEKEIERMVMKASRAEYLVNDMQVGRKESSASTAEPSSSGASTYCKDVLYVASTVSSGKLRRKTCYVCGENGHLSSACPKVPLNVEAVTINEVDNGDSTSNEVDNAGSSINSGKLSITII